MNYKVKSIHIYPIKSLQGINVTSSNLIATGLQYDRQWMLVDHNNQFITQRSFPQMATMQPAIKNDQLIVTAQNGDSITLDLNQESISDITVTVWRDTVKASLEKSFINDWFSEHLKTSCQLVRLASNEKRLIDKNYAFNNEIVSFADGYPLLIVSQSNIELLNSKLKESVDMNRFRPNIVIEGLSPHAEDKIQSLIINDINIKLVKPCERCNVPTIHQTTGDKRKDILRTLFDYRQIDKKIYFGMNAIHQSTGQIKVNQSVTVME